MGSADLGDNVVETAARMRDALGLNLEERRRFTTWTDALRRFIEQADALGVLVMVSGVVGSNSRRGLDPQEFRGFALADSLAPLVFVNGADTKAAQMFTLAHELAHIWLGQSGVSDTEARAMPDQAVERWCNRVAAELLVPLDALRGEIDAGADLQVELSRLARRFKVSTLVALRCIHDAGQLSREELWAAYDAELVRLRAVPKGSGGRLLPHARRPRQQALCPGTGGEHPRRAYRIHRDLPHARPEEDGNFQRARTQLGGGVLMGYLLDANVFIAANNLHYGLDFCPAFWDWLVAGNESERVFSVEKVGDELHAVGDELSKWAAERADTCYDTASSSGLPDFRWVALICGST